MVILSSNHIVRIVFIFFCSIFAFSGSLQGKNQQKEVVKDDFELFSLTFRSENDWKPIEIMTFRLRMDSMLSKKMSLRFDDALIGFTATRRIYEDKKAKRAIDTYVNSYWVNQYSFFEFLESSDSTDLNSMLSAVFLDPKSFKDKVINSFTFNISKVQPIQVELFFNSSEKTVKIKVSLYEPDLVKHFDLYKKRYITGQNLVYFFAFTGTIFGCYAINKWAPWLPGTVMSFFLSVAASASKKKKSEVVVNNNTFIN